MKRFGITFEELYKLSIEDDILLEGLQYTHRSDVTLNNIIKTYGNLILGRFCQSSASNHSTTPKEYIDIVHKVDISNNKDIINRLKFFGYHYVNTKQLSISDMEYLQIPLKYGNVYVSTFEGSYPTEIKRDNLPKVLYHITLSTNVDKIKKFGLLPKESTNTFNHPSNRIYLFATVDPNNDIPKLIQILANNTGNNIKDYSVLKIVDYYPNHERFFLDPAMDIGDISDRCRGVFVHRGINPSYIEV